mgnify:CR=1 FL=1
MEPQGLTSYVVCGESTKINYICCTYNESTRIIFKCCICEESTMYGCIFISLKGLSLHVVCTMSLKPINSVCCVLMNLQGLIPHVVHISCVLNSFCCM